MRTTWSIFPGFEQYAHAVPGARIVARHTSDEEEHHTGPWRELVPHTLASLSRALNRSGGGVVVGLGRMAPDVVLASRDQNETRDKTS